MSFGYSDSISFNGVSVFALGNLVLNSLSIDVDVDTNRSLMMTFSSQFFVRGSQAKVNILIYKGASVPTLLQDAYVVVDLIVYYTDGANFEFGTYFRRFSINPKIFSDEILYEIDFKEEINNVLNYFSTKVSDPKAEDVGFAGRFSIQTEFANSTGIVSDKGYLRFPLTFDGNMSFVTLDVTIPEEYDLETAKLDLEDMVKIFPNRVREIFTVTKDNRKLSELYIEWKIPPPSSPPSLFEQHPWILPFSTCFLGLFLGFILNNYIYPRYFKPHSHLHVLYDDSTITIENIGKAPVEWVVLTVRTKYIDSMIKNFTIKGSLNIRKPEPYIGGSYFRVIINDIAPKDWGAIEIEIAEKPGILVEVDSSCKHEIGGKETISMMPTHGKWGKEESYNDWLNKHLK
jgi:hypothetical protein